MKHYIVGFFILCLLSHSVRSDDTDNTFVRPCGPRDYAYWNSTSCDQVTNTRTVLYKLGGSYCDGPQYLMAPSASCECMLEEYVPTYSNCSEDGTRTVVNWNTLESGKCKRNENLFTSMKRIAPSDTTTTCACTDDDIGSTFTPCDPDTNKRWVVYFWNRDCITNADVALPTASDIACDLECDDGQYLGPPNRDCEDCPAGTYSLVGVRYTAPFNSIPKEFQTKCEATSCSPWIIQNGFLSSGVNPDNSVTTLKFVANLKTTGFLKLTYLVSCEMFGDSFRVYVDGEVAYQRRGVMKSWETVGIDLEEANSKCKWGLTAGGQSVCVVQNMLVPYNKYTFFDPTSQEGISTYKSVALTRDKACDPKAYTTTLLRGNVAVIQMVYECSTEMQFMWAQNGGARAVVMVHEYFYAGDARLTGSSSGLTIPIMSVTAGPGSTLIANIAAAGSMLINISYIPFNKDLGNVEIKFEYSKDSADAEGDDRVLIREIVVEGTEYAASYCNDCPAGTGSDPRSTTCTACPVNTYAPTTGIPWPCKPCPEGQVSFPGSVACFPMPKCNLEDYDVSVRGCYDDPKYGLVRRASYIKKSPAPCDYANAPTIPSSLVSADGVVTQITACESCRPGAFRNYSSKSCDMCPQGTVPEPKYNEGNQSQPCSACPAGSYSLQVLSYPDFWDLEVMMPSSWTTSCDGCEGVKGWDFFPVMEEGVSKMFLTAGRLVGSDASSTLTIPFELDVTGGAVTFAYEYRANSADENYVGAYIDVIQQQSSTTYKLNTTKDNEKYSVFVIPPTTHRKFYVSWRLQKTNYTYNRVLFVLRSLSVEHEVTGGSTKCLACPEGYSCTTGVPVMCMPGEYSLGATMPCTKCPLGKISYTKGATRCMACPWGMVSNAKSTRCLFSSSMPRFQTITNRTYTYDLTFIMDRMIGPAQATTSAIPSPTIWRPITNVGETFFFSLDMHEGLPLTRCGGVITGPKVCLSEYYYFSPKAYDVVTDVQLSKRSLLVSPIDEMYDIMITYTNPDEICPSTNKSAQVKVLLICDPSMYQNATGTISVINSDPCNAILAMPTGAACPVCVLSTGVLRKALTDCSEDNQQTLVYSYNTSTGGANCVGGVPRSVNQECDFTWTLKRHKDAVITMIVLTMIALMLLVVGIVHLYVSRKKLQNEYEQLVVNETNVTGRELSMVSPDSRLATPTAAEGYMENNNEPNTD